MHHCVWYQPSSEALDFHQIMWRGVRSKVVHGEVMEALVFATVCDLLSVRFLRDLIIDTQSNISPPANKHLQELQKLQQYA